MSLSTCFNIDLYSTCESQLPILLLSRPLLLDLQNNKHNNNKKNMSEREKERTSSASNTAAQTLSFVIQPPPHTPLPPPPAHDDKHIHIKKKIAGRTRLTDSRLRTWRSVCELSKIFMYAASVSWIVWSYSERACCFLCKLSLILESLSVKIAKSFCIFAFSSSSFKICRFTSSRFSRKSSIHLTSWLL